MSNQPPPQSASVFKNPQIILALISGVVTIIAAFIGVLPHILPSAAAVTPTVKPIVVTATALPSPTPVATEGQAVETPTILPPQPTLISLIQPTPNTQPTVSNLTTNNTPNVKLIYDKVSFNLLNQSDHTLSLLGVTFQSTSGTWDARKWGPSIYISLPIAKCLRLRDASSGQRTPPAACANHLYGLIEAGPSTLFWINTDHFDVLRSEQTIATCDTSASECDIYIPLA